LNHFLINLAQAAQQQGQDPLRSMIIPMVAIFGIFYFLVIRPQSKKAKETQRMLSELKKGDDVVTQGGIIGKISGIKDNEITLQIQEGVRIRVLRSSVTGIYTGAAPSAPKADAKAS